jgi:hypothetical protein
MVINNLDLCQRFSDARCLHATEIAHLRDSGFIYSDGVSYMLTEQGRNLITSNRVAPLGEGSSQCPDDDSYLVPPHLDTNPVFSIPKVGQHEVVAAQAAINAAARGALDVQPGGDHYREMKIQPVEFIEANGLRFLEGCIIKRACRHGSKSGAGAKDLRKIIHEAQLLLQLRYGEQA